MLVDAPKIRKVPRCCKRSIDRLRSSYPAPPPTDSVVRPVIPCADSYRVKRKTYRPERWLALAISATRINRQRVPENVSDALSPYGGE